MRPSNLTIDIWPVTDPGQIEKENEDFVLVFQPPDENQARFSGSLYVVVDGAGGGDTGKLASRYTAEKIMHGYFTNPDPDVGYRLRMAIEEANADLFEHTRQQTELVKMGAAVTAAVIRGEQLAVAWVGNCRAYLIRDGAIHALTRDHTLVQQLLDEEAITPDEAAEHPRRDVVLRMLGSAQAVQVDVYDGRLKADDVLVLCSDGLTQVLHPDEIASIAGGTSPRNATMTMLQKANDRGSRDNVSIITALVRAGAPPLETDIPHMWEGQVPSFDLDAGHTLVRRRADILPEAPPPALEETPPDLMATVQGRRIATQDMGPVGTALPPDQTAPAPQEPVPAPSYQTPVQPAPPYGGPPVAPPPPQPPPAPQPAYPAQPGYAPPAGYPPQEGYAPQPDYPAQPGYPPPGYPQQFTGPSVPRGYQPPPGYVVDPVTGLPPTPVQGGPGYGGTPYQARVYQPLTGPNVTAQPRRGITLGTFAIVGVAAVLLTAAMVVILINPFDWTLPFGNKGEETAGGETGGQASGTVAPSPTVPLPPSQPPPPSATIPPTAPPAPPGMVLVAEGSFMRGVTDEEIQQYVLACIDESDEAGDPRCRFEYFQDAQPVEEVTLAAFYMDVTEVTNLNYANCVAAEVCTPPRNQEFYADTAFAQHPVVYVTYDQATTYCTWAGKRLPTEAEWEKAARWDAGAGISLTFPWGNTWEAGRANTAVAGLGGTAAVQAFAQDISPSGVLGMTGNVSEWVQDWYFPDYSGLGTLNPVRLGNQPLPTPERAVRGGWWGEELTAYLRAGHRLSAEFDNSADWLGFRCVGDIGGPASPTPPPSPTPGTTTTPGATGSPAGQTPTGEPTTPVP